MDKENKNATTVKNFRERVVLTNIKALIASTRAMSTARKGEYYSKYRVKYPNQRTQKRHFTIWGIRPAYAAIFALLIGLSIALYNSQSIVTDSIPKFTTVVTENGQKTKVELADGTEVWLNYGSKISYNNSFGSNNRDVTLTGEAFFAVKKNKVLPFRVTTENLQVKVLGTKFNVKAYPNAETVKVSLNEGSLEVSDSKNKLFTYRIKPGEEAKYTTKNGKLEINNVNSNKISAWKEGYLYFEKTPVNLVFAELERKYNVEVITTDSTVLNSVVTATIKDEPMNDVFKSIAYSCKLRYRILHQKSLEKQIKIYISKN